jgi:cyanophycinase
MSAIAMSSRTDESADIPRIDAVAERKPRRGAGRAKGTLVLIGGACTTRGRALGSFLDLTNARAGGRIIGITVASTRETERAMEWLSVFRAAGATNVEIPMFDRRDDTRDAETAEMIRGAAGVFLGGGDQVKLVASLSGTRTCAAMHELHRLGGVICGTSAGAAALSELTMAGGEMDEEGNLVEQYLGPGLGFLGFNAIIDTHFSQRRRLQRLFLVVAANRELLGIGIDENTALVVRGHRGEVLGAGGVTFVDGRDTVRYDNTDSMEHGRQLTLSHLRVGLVGTRHYLNLRERELDELVAASANGNGSS